MKQVYLNGMIIITKRDKNLINKNMNILLWLTDRPAYRMIKKIRWEIQVMDLADKLRNTNK